MSGLLGQNDKGPYIELTHLGQSYLYPLTAQPEELPGATDIQTSTLESFSPSAVAGDPSLVSNELLAVLLWSNWQRGMGTTKYREQEGTGSLDSFAYATMDTRYEGLALLPPRRKPLGTILSVTVTDFLYLGYSAPYQTIGWGGFEGSGQFVAHGATNNGTLATTWATGTLAGGVTAVRQVVAFNGLLVAITNRAIYTCDPAGTTWVERWVSAGGFYGLTAHDNKLYTIRDSDKKLYWTLTPTTASAWANSSTDPLNLDPNETVLKIVEWKNRQDTRSLFILTNKRIMAFDDDNYWATFLPEGQVPGRGGDLAVWPQDKALYYAPNDVGANVMQFQGQTISNVSPNKRGGLTGSFRRVLIQLRGGLNFFFGRTTRTFTAQALGFANTTLLPADQQGTIMAFNGQGWHTLVEGDAVNGAIMGMTWAKDQIIYSTLGGNVFTIYTPDAPQPPPLIEGPVEYQEGTFFLQSGDADAGLENTDKTLRYWEIIVEDQAGNPGIPAGHTMSFEYTVDNSAVAYYPATNVGPGGGRVLRYRTVLPGGAATPIDQGTPFRFLRWKISFTKSPGASATVSPVLRGVAAYYLRSPDLIDGIQFQIDLSPNRVKQLYALHGAQYAGRTPEKLRAILQEIKLAKTNCRIEYGPANNRVVIPAAEMRIASRESARTGLGVYIVTARNVSTPS